MQRVNLMRTVATNNDPLLNPTSYESDGESLDDSIREKSEEELPVLMDLIIEDYLVEDKDPRSRARDARSAKKSDSSSRMSFMQKMKSWKEDLWGSVVHVDKILTKKAEEKQRELSEGDRTLEDFKDKFMPTKEACEVVLDPKYEGKCLGADMNKLACEPLLNEAPSVWKEVVSDRVPAAMEEVINLSSNMLNDAMEMAIEDEEKEQELERIRIKKFFEFYKSHRERRLRQKMEQLKQEIVQDTSAIVQDACKDALASQVLQQSENIHGSKENYHKLIEGTLPMVPLEAARNIQQRFTEIVGKAIGTIDQMQEEILEQSTNYNNLVNKLKEMVIHEDPPVKRSRSEYIEETEEEITRKYKRVTVVKSLTDLCIATCAEYVEYLPELPEGCFPEELIQKLLTLLVQQNKMDDLTLEKLLNPSIISLSLVHSRQILDSSAKAIATRCVFLRKLNMKECSNITNDSLFAIVNGCADLEFLNLEGCSGIDDDGVRAIARKCSGLTSINLSQCTKITDSSLQELIYRCHGLTHICLRKCTQITDGAFTQVGNLQELVQMDLSDCNQISDRTLFNLSKCSKLRCLKVLGNKAQISDNGVCTLVSTCSDLRVLELVGCDISDKSVRYISTSCPYIKRLSLAFCKKVTDAAFQFDSAIFDSTGQDIPFPGIPVHLENEGTWRRSTHFGSPTNSSLSGSWGSRGGFQVKAQSNFYNLQHLDLTRCLNVGDKTLEKLAIYCPNLKVLYLSACEEVSDAGILHLVRSKKGICKRLRRLSLSKCRRITDASIVDVARQAGESLKFLSLENCHLVSDLTVLSLAQYCPNLEELDLTSCERVGDFAIKNLMLGCRNIQSISLEELTNLTEEGICALTNAYRLKTLRLGYCKGVTNDCLQNISAACPDIINLDLSYCNNPNFTLDGLQEVIGRWEELTVLNLRGINSFTNQSISHPNLQTLNLSWCKYMQDEALEGIAIGCPRLSSIDLAWCSKVTGSAVHRLAQRSQSLRTFNLRGCRVPNITIQFLTHAGKMVYK